MSFWSRFWRLLGPFWPPFWALLAAQIGPSPAQEAPRSPQDGPKIVLDRFFLLLIFRFDFFMVLGSILVPFWPPKWAPGGAPILRESALGGPKTVPRSSWFGPFFVLSFGIAFLVVLGSFWGAPGVGFFGSSTHRFNPSTHQLVDSTHQLINLSTRHPTALRHFLTRPGGLRAARLNKFSEVVFPNFWPLDAGILIFCPKIKDST